MDPSCQQMPISIKVQCLQVKDPSSQHKSIRTSNRIIITLRVLFWSKASNKPQPCINSLSITHTTPQHPYVIPPTPPPPSTSTPRTIFTDSQLEVLEKRFQTKNLIRKKECRELGKEIGLSEMQVKNWFKNRKRKIRNETKKLRKQEQA
ncbi:unnamed protein product [Caenorhabditis nigoni]